MLAAGLLAEVEALAPRLGVTAAQAVGYRELLAVVRGEWTLEYATRRAVDATTSLARRQRTFHRRDPRVRWLQWDDDAAAVTAAAEAALEEAGWTS
jgi:tRNA dimethylallyltransferase